MTQIVDGRSKRAEQNREAIIEALIACYEDGILRPSVNEVAGRAGVSARSVHNHFADVEALRAEVARRQWDRQFSQVGSIAWDLPSSERIAAVVTQRSQLFEAVTPVRRAALLSVDESPTIATNLARLDRRLRRELEALFPDLASVELDALDAVLSWDTWNRLRRAQGCSPTRARRVLTTMVVGLVEGSSE